MKYIASIILLFAVIFPISAKLTSPTLRIERDMTPVNVVSYTVSSDSVNNLEPRYIKFDSEASQGAAATITLNGSDLKQEIDGFGFAITGSASYNLMKMEETMRNGFLTKIFSPQYGYGCSYIRVPIGCSDFSLSEYTCCDTQGINNFALTDEEKKYIIPVVKKILEINPDVKIISAPWTAPRWMKTVNSWTGGHLSTTYYQDYATYFVKWIQAFKSYGINITAVTPQNEPQNPGNSASMLMDWEEERDFIKNALGPKFKNAGITTQIFVFDHNYNYDNKLNGKHYPIEIYKDADAKKYITGAAYHNYGGNASTMTTVHDAYPDMQLLFTEWTAGTWSSGVGISEVTSDVKNLVFDVVNNWGRGAMVWNLMLDSDRGPNRPTGCVTGNGAVDIEKSDYKTIHYRSFYYTMCLASVAARPGAHRITASGSASGLNYVAFKNPDGGYGIVMTNTGDSEKKICVNDGTNRFAVTIPAKSATSCRW